MWRTDYSVLIVIEGLVLGYVPYVMRRLMAFCKREGTRPVVSEGLLGACVLLDSETRMIFQRPAVMDSKDIKFAGNRIKLERRIRP